VSKLVAQIIRELYECAEDEEGRGLSYWNLYKIIKAKYGGDVEPSHVKYHLDQLVKNGLLKKKGPRYILESPVIGIDGMVLFVNPPVVVNCPFYDQCKSRNCAGDGCKLFELMPEGIREFYFDLIKEKEEENEA